MLPPGSTIGILGGGQLGRMLAIAAARLGFHCHIYCPEPESPAFEVASAHTLAAYEDEAALAAFAKGVQVVTLEFENVPVETLRFLEARVPVAPSSGALEIAQDRLAEKTFAERLGLRTAPFADIASVESLHSALDMIGLPAILKTRRFGYDGKGQVKIVTREGAASAFQALRDSPAILEGFVRFSREVSVIAARTVSGEFVAFEVTENEHRNHILDRSMVPARIGERACGAAMDAARKIGDGLGYVGTFAVEFFVVGDGDAEDVVVNEIAPRVHNSGHWTIDGAVTCQFEQHIRAICGWPLGSARRRERVEMINLVGADMELWAELAAQPATKMHLYGKSETRRGRKMGHATRLLGNP
ncbi:MAG: 5-(carboxyamino)imidazole ribonucleotide synthase [Rhizobiales bacterium]|nr:5-(carboxyamino)imidazole ribonucleotide synthase [Hyphomicrobiales bacterium]